MYYMIINFLHDSGAIWWWG